METARLMVIFGTRPEAIKMVPVIRALSQDSRFKAVVTITAQHRQMLDQVLNYFCIKPDYDLNIMQKDQTLTAITTRVLDGLGHILDQEQPDMVLVHGDTTTTFAASLAAFYRQIPISHVEAGLRTFNKLFPYPEEMNRKLTGSLADLHFAPTALAKDNLLREGVASDNIFVTGNTIIDVLYQTVDSTYSFGNCALNAVDFGAKKTILLTCHRRENLGRPMRQIFAAVSSLAGARDDIQFIFPVHLNPRIQKAAQVFANAKNVLMTDPLEYQDLVNVMNRCDFVLTDSGGIQEEAAALGKPVLVLRDTTERTEALESGSSRLVGTQTEKIIEAAGILLDDREKYAHMANMTNPFGDGKASQRIAKILAAYLFDG